MRRFIIILSILFFAQSALAFQFVSPNAFKSPMRKFFDKVWECTWHISCYSKPKLGAFTELNLSDSQVDFPALYNANLALTLEVGTTSVASITTLPGLTSASSLATIGTITTGVWNATAIPVNKGGTGTTSPSQYLVILGNGSLGLTVASSTGTSGQFLTSNGGLAYPSWQSSSVNQNLDYTWTAHHIFNTASTTIGKALELNDSRIYSTSTKRSEIKYLQSDYASTTSLTVGDTANIAGLQVTGTASTSGYLLSYKATSTAIGLQVSAGNTTSQTTDCPAGSEVMSGGYTVPEAVQGGNPDYVVYESYPSSATAWSASAICDNATCATGLLTVYAVCADIRK